MPLHLQDREAALTAGILFTYTCGQRFDKTKCGCLVEIARGIDPAVADKAYSQDYVYGLLQKTRKIRG